MVLHFPRKCVVTVIFKTKYKDIVRNKIYNKSNRKQKFGIKSAIFRLAKHFKIYL